MDWLPGVLSKTQVLELKSDGFLHLTEDPGAIDHSAIDLHLSDEGYVLPEGSAKPSGNRFYLGELQKQGLTNPLKSEGGTYVLRRKTTYVFKLRERINFPDRSFHGQATAKSSVGRVDVLARLIVDGAADYEKFSPEDAANGSGELYVEITPITFDVRVRAGIALTQLRLFLGDPRSVEIEGEVLYRTVLKNSTKNDGTLSVDLSEVSIGGLQTCAFATKVEKETEPIPLWEEGSKPNPWRYWSLKRPDSRQRLRIEKGEFYILRSREVIALPAGVAVYCRASDETIGEMRIHYAGFVHPFFGRNREDEKIGTPLIFEVRGHDVHVSLRDGERMARLIFYRMSQDATTPEKKPYDDQSLQLSKFFGKWPERLRWVGQPDGDGRVEPREEP